jgi:hypothetical protein
MRLTFNEVVVRVRPFKVPPADEDAGPWDRRSDILAHWTIDGISVQRQPWALQARVPN